MGQNYKRQAYDLGFYILPGDDRSYETVSGREAVTALSYTNVCNVASRPS